MKCMKTFYRAQMEILKLVGCSAFTTTVTTTITKAAL